MLTDEMKAAGWIEHDGGPCPVPLDTMPRLMFRCGEEPAAYVVEAGMWEWDHAGHDYDIIAYKPETPHD